MTDIIGTPLAGLGLFYAGFKLLRKNLERMTSHRSRAMVSRWTGPGWRASLCGLALGVLAQSTAGVTFIVVSLRSGGLIPSTRQALSILCWANVGLSVLVLAAMSTSFDFSVVTLYLLD